MSKQSREVLLIEDNRDDAQLIARKIAAADAGEFAITRAESLSAARILIRRLMPSAILLDLNLPDSRGVDSLRAVRASAPATPIVVLSSAADDAVSAEALTEGAHDFLAKDAVDGFEITKSLRYAISRANSEESCRAIVEHSIQGVAILQDDRVVVVNQQAVAITGYSKTELVGMKRDRLAALAHPDDREQVLGHIEQRMANCLAAEMLSFRVIRKDGQVRWLEARDKRIPYRSNPALFMSFIDATESRAEQAAQAHLAALVNTSADAILSKSLDGTILSWNRRAETMYGYSRAEAVGAQVDLLIPSDRLSEKQEIIDSVRAGRAIENMRTERLRKDGARISVSLSASPIFDPAGSIVAVSVIARDITEDIRTTQTLELQARLLDTVVDGVFMHDLEGNLLYVNESACASHGYTREEIMAINLKDLDTPEYAALLPARKEELRENGQGCFQTAHFRKDGSVLPLEVHTRAIHIGDRPVVLSVARDITRRLRHQEQLAEEKERLATTLRCIGDGVITADLDGAVIIMNQSAEELCGIPTAEAKGRPCSAVLPIVRRSDGSSWDDLLVSAAAGKAAQRPEEQFLLHTAGGDEKILLINIAALESRELSSLGLVIVLRDITAQVRAQDELVRAQKLESLGVLAGGIAHDFNNLLLAIWGNISLIKEEAGHTASVRRQLDRIERASMSARRLTEQFLTFSKGGAPVRSVAELGPLLRDAAKFAVRGLNVTLEFAFADRLRRVYIDEGQIRQVITNLALNAAQAMPRGGRIVYTANNETVAEDDLLPIAPGEYVQLAVRDYGEGIAAEYLDKIFDPYFTTKPDGSGLGLSSAYSIIRAHDGYMTVESEPGAGTSFHVYLPATHAETNDALSAENRVIQHGSGLILVMDDEQFVRETVHDMLDTLGYTGVFAEDGGMAISLFQNQLSRERPFDAVILDLTVPGGMGGAEAAERLRRLAPDCKMIVSSGYANDNTLADYRGAGFDAVIAKPYSLRNLAATLAGLLSPQSGAVDKQHTRDANMRARDPDG